MSDGGKGSKLRPPSIEYDKYSSNWDTIFRKSPKEIDDAVIEEEAFKIIEERNKNVISDQKPD
jgi:hypothetical protein